MPEEPAAADAADQLRALVAVLKDSNPPERIPRTPELAMAVAGVVSQWAKARPRDPDMELLRGVTDLARELGNGRQRSGSRRSISVSGS